jgi:hypothetical protein
MSDQTGYSEVCIVVTPGKRFEIAPGSFHRMNHVWDGFKLASAPDGDVSRVRHESISALLGCDQLAEA